MKKAYVNFKAERLHISGVKYKASMAEFASFDLAKKALIKFFQEKIEQSKNADVANCWKRQMNELKKLTQKQWEK